MKYPCQWDSTSMKRNLRLEDLPKQILLDRQCFKRVRIRNLKLSWKVSIGQKLAEVKGITYPTGSQQWLVKNGLPDGPCLMIWRDWNLNSVSIRWMPLWCECNLRKLLSAQSAPIQKLVPSFTSKPWHIKKALLADKGKFLVDGYHDDFKTFLYFE